MIRTSRYRGWFSTKSGFSTPSGVNRRLANIFSRNGILIASSGVRPGIRDGAIRSVLMLVISIGAATPVTVVNFSICMCGRPAPLVQHLADVGDAAGDGGGC